MTDTKAAAKRLFEASSPSIVGTDAETYFQVRGISPLASPPPCLRFAAKLKHPNEQFFPGTHRPGDESGNRRTARRLAARLSRLGWQGEGAGREEGAEALARANEGRRRQTRRADRGPAAIDRRRRGDRAHRNGGFKPARMVYVRHKRPQGVHAAASESTTSSCSLRTTAARIKRRSRS